MLSTLLFNVYTNDLPDFLNEESNTKEGQLHIPKPDNGAINNSSFSDDLTILSWFKYSIQKKTCNLKIYCHKWVHKTQFR